MEDSALKDQYRRLQEQQQRKLERLRDLQNGKNKLTTPATAPKVQSAFGVTDELDLKGSINLAVENDNKSQNDQLRQLKDENGRLYKLLSEKDCEVRAMKRKVDQRSQPPSAVRASIADPAGITGGVGGDVAAVKIMNLSKKIRDLTCDLEAERTKTAQLTKRCTTLETAGKVQPEVKAPSESQLADELKSTKDKLKQTETRLLEARNQHQITGHELKLAIKALTDELGGDQSTVNLHDILSGQSNWRGRQQKIISLQTRVRDLERQLADCQYPGGSSMTSPDLMISEARHSGATNFGRTSLASIPTSSLSAGVNTRELRQREAVVKLQKARQEALDRSEKEVKTLEAENQDFRRKAEASKARCKVLSTEMRTLKEKITVLLEKGHHDDELIASLLKQQSMLQSSFEAVSEAKRFGDVTQSNRVVQLEHEAKIVDRLKEIITEKEAQIVRLQEQMAATTSSDGIPQAPINAPSSPREPLAKPPCDMVSRGVSPLGCEPSLPPSVDLEQTRTLLATAEVERDRLRELTVVQERRCEDLILKQVGKDQEMTSLRRRLTNLERQIQRLGGSLPHNSASSVVGGDEATSALLRDGLPVTLETIDSLQQSLSLSLDEASALKQAVRSALEAKQADLKMLTDIVGQTRAQFLQGIRNVKEKMR